MVLDRYAYLICVLWQEGGMIRKTGEGNCGIMNANNETGVAARKRSLNHSNISLQLWYNNLTALAKSKILAPERTLNHNFCAVSTGSYRCCGINAAIVV